jgi:uncharacterized membrane protein
MSQKDSGNKVYNILAFVFDGEKRAQEVAREVKWDVKATATEMDMKIISTAVVAVDARGKTHVHETGHGGRGAGIGVVAGGLLGLIGGPAGLLVWAVGGAVIGGIAGRHVGRAVPESDLKALGEQLPPNSSALLILVEDKHAESVIDDMKGYSARIVTLTVADQLSGEIAVAVAGDVTGPPDESQAGDKPAAAIQAGDTPAAAGQGSDEPAAAGQAPAEATS